MNNTGQTKSIKSAVIEDGNVCINLSGKDNVIKYCFIFLRDNCRCSECYNYVTFQRNKHLLDIPKDCKLKKIVNETDKIKIEWDDGHMSEYTSKFVWEYSYEEWKRQRKVSRQLWAGKDVKNQVAFVDREEFMTTDKGLKRFLQSLITYGIAFVDNVAPNMEDTELVIKRVAPVQRTLFGDTWCFTSDQARADTAYTTIPLGPHTDNTYFTEAAGLQVLHCLEHTGSGGENVLLDGFFGATELRKKNPKAFETLVNTLQPAEYLEEGWHHEYTAPVIRMDPISGDLQQIRFNVYDRSSHCAWPAEQAPAMYEAIRELALLYNKPEGQWWFKLNPGRVLFFDNWRVLHGRAGFTGKRVVGGGYVSRGDWLSAARVKGLIA